MNNLYKIDLHGKRFSRLTPIRYLHNSIWECLCDCGNKINVTLDRLRSGRVKSCGCLKKEQAGKLNYQHGLAETPTHNSWTCMLRRCRSDYFQRQYYYDRGITVCEEWHNFKNFLDDMGIRPDHTSLERVDCNLGYFKENCIWADDVVQANNKRNNRVLEYGGEKITLSQWARRLGVPRQSLQSRLSRGWSTERIIETPIKGSNGAMAVRVLMNLNSEKGK